VRAAVRRHNAPQARLFRAKLALLLQAQPALDNAAAGRRLGKHANGVRYWRRIWATEGFRLTDQTGRGHPPAFPPRDVATGKALAGALPTRRDAPLARYSTADRAFQVGSHPERPPMSASTIGRILDGDALKPWQHRSWITPRDPQFAAKAGRVLDLYAGWWDGEPLDPADCVLSADEKTNIQAWVRCHTTTPTRPGQPMRVEHEYDRSGALAYLAASSTTAAATGARRPLTDSGSATPTFILAHLPIHASWLNQIEIFFSIVQRKVLAPNDFPTLLWARSSGGCWPSRRGTTTPPCPSTGASPASTSKPSSPRSQTCPHRAWTPPHRRLRPRTHSPPNPTRIHETAHVAYARALSR